MPGTSDRLKFDAVLFDCDGVLVDSEHITNGVLRDMLEERGWKLTAEECMRHFLGKTLRQERALIESNTGQPLTEEWLADFRARRDARLGSEVLAIPGALEAVAWLHERLEGRIACASGADLGKVALQLRRCGYLPYFEGRFFSGHDQPRSKPFPDVYLAAAKALGVQPARCVVVEDTVTGVTAGVAAGATVFAYSPADAGHDGPAALRAAGAAHVFSRMSDLPSLLS